VAPQPACPFPNLRRIDLYGSATHYLVPVVVKSLGTPASGTLKVAVTGTHQAASTGNYVESGGVAARR
jgi:hypothetical protein